MMSNKNVTSTSFNGIELNEIDYNELDAVYQELKVDKYWSTLKMLYWTNEVVIVQSACAY